eukprot:TRINITY_DN662_c0_g1_i1.p2 TRINITY_DN662_c0_g1~~TRINITY_DN662_c0_g1_i1.p2  ORF type:complete len:201 (+),score=66.67 TRINITY_DN662_c0_g1_i1:756-1358(+)
MSFSRYVDLSKASFWESVAVTALAPTIWNIVARKEYKDQTVSKVFGGNRTLGAYAMAAWIFGFSTYRDMVFKNACDDQVSVMNDGNRSLLQVIGYSLLSVGTVFVGSSFARLGITGTFLGDYFGILMDEMVTGFPFNVLSHPMYVGATMNFLGLASLSGSVAGALLTAWVGIVYYISSTFYEGPFTAMIYEEKAKKEKQQ